MNIKDIARIVGVSASTVSRVLNYPDKNYASKEIQDQIWDTVNKTGYIPNDAARSLRRGNVHTLSQNVITNSIAIFFARSNDTTSDPFFTRIARGIESEAFKHKYTIKYSLAAPDFDNEVINMMYSTKVNGVAILGRYNKKLLTILKNYHKNIVYTGLNEIIDNYDQVICDGYKASITAISYLHDLGHRKIGYIGETQKEIRFLGYQDALKKHSLPVYEDYIVNVPVSMQGGYNGAKKLFSLKRLPTAFFCANDLTAIGVIKAANESGIKIPDDFSIISIDDIEAAQYIVPMLTTVHIPLYDLGIITAKTLIDRIEKGHTLAVKTLLPFYIAIRESTKYIYNQ